MAPYWVWRVEDCDGARGSYCVSKSFQDPSRELDREVGKKAHPLQKHGSLLDAAYQLKLQFLHAPLGGSNVCAVGQSE